ncbi:hypothetical protein [Kamptonema formosum]|uniref:hypothetical protein n=1 Tax=Kamptonema formosum TaxID=331992 RepID=UPI00034A3549|nr:hypothetical protein [Oscillatoria sp. PCC 10802]
MTRLLTGFIILKKPKIEEGHRASGIGHQAWRRGHGAWEFSALPNASCHLPNSDIVIRIANSAPDMAEEVLKLLYSPGFAT